MPPRLQRISVYVTAQMSEEDDEEYEEPQAKKKQQKRPEYLPKGWKDSLQELRWDSFSLYFSHA